MVGGSSPASGISAPPKLGGWMTAPAAQTRQKVDSRLAHDNVKMPESLGQGWHFLPKLSELVSGTDIMTKSLSVSLVDCKRSLSTSVAAAASSAEAIAGSTTANPSARCTDGKLGDMSKSFASFHLSNKAKGNMEASVDQLFREEQSNGGGDMNVDSCGAVKQGTPEYSNRQQKIDSGGCGVAQSGDQPLLTQHRRQQHGHDLEPSSTRSKRATSQQGPPRFQPICSLEDVQAIRCAEFHPNGRVFAVGSNSKVLRICQYQGQHGVSDENR